jgi:hypothetical protein
MAVAHKELAGKRWLVVGHRGWGLGGGSCFQARARITGLIASVASILVARSSRFATGRAAKLRLIVLPSWSRTGREPGEGIGVVRAASCQRGPSGVDVGSEEIPSRKMRGSKLSCRVWQKYNNRRPGSPQPGDAFASTVHNAARRQEWMRLAPAELAHNADMPCDSLLGG